MPTATIKDAIAYMERRIEERRRVIARDARSLVRALERLALSAEKGDVTEDCPIQQSATILNTYCGELAAMTDALQAMRATEGEG